MSPISSAACRPIGPPFKEVAEIIAVADEGHLDRPVPDRGRGGVAAARRTPSPSSRWASRRRPETVRDRARPRPSRTGGGGCQEELGRAPARSIRPGFRATARIPPEMRELELARGCAMTSPRTIDPIVRRSHRRPRRCDSTRWGSNSGAGPRRDRKRTGDTPGVPIFDPSPGGRLRRPRRRRGVGRPGPGRRRRRRRARSGRGGTRTPRRPPGQAEDPDIAPVSVFARIHPDLARRR